MDENESAQAPRSYKAFFSYARADARTADWLWRELDRYQTPRSLVGVAGAFGPVPAKLHPIFRDTEDLSGGGELPARLKESLEKSEALIVLCTPASANRPWVNQEVLEFQRLAHGDRIFPVIAMTGEADRERPFADYLPPALRDGAIVAADLREFQGPGGQTVGDGKDRGKLKLIAGLLGLPLDTLVRRERARQRALRIGFGAAAAVFAVLAVVAVAFAVQAERQRKAASQARSEAQGRAYSALVSLADAQYAQGDGRGAKRSLERAASLSPDPDRPDVAWALQWRRLSAPERQICTPPPAAVAVAAGDRSGWLAISGARLGQPNLDNAIRLEPVTGSRPAWTLPGHPRGIRSMAFSRDGSRLVTGGLNDGAVKVWDLSTKRELWAAPPWRVPSMVHDVEFADGDRIVVAHVEPRNATTDATHSHLVGYRRYVALFDASSGAVIELPKTAQSDFPYREDLGMAVSPSGRQVVITQGGRLELYALDPPLRRMNTITLAEPGAGVTFLNEDTIAIAGAYVQVVDLESGTVVRTLGDGQAPVVGLAVLPHPDREDAPLLVTATSTGHFQTYDHATGRQTPRLVTTFGVESIAPTGTRDGVHVAAADGCVFRVSLSDILPPRALPGYDVALSSDRRTAILIDEGVGRTVVGSQAGATLIDTELSQPLAQAWRFRPEAALTSTLVTPGNTLVTATQHRVTGASFDDQLGKPGVPHRYSMAGHLVGRSPASSVGAAIPIEGLPKPTESYTLQFIDLDTGEVLGAWAEPVFSPYRTDVAFSRDGGLALVEATNERQGKPRRFVLDFSDRGKVSASQALPDSVRSAAIWDNDVILLLLGGDGATRAAQAQQGLRLLMGKGDERRELPPPRELGDADVAEFVAVHRGPGIVARMAGGGAQLWERTPGGGVRVTDLPTLDRGDAFWLDAERRRILIGGGGGAIRIFDIDQEMQLFSLDLGVQRVGSIEVTEDDRKVLVSTHSDTHRQVHLVDQSLHAAGAAGDEPSAAQRLLAQQPPAELHRARAALLAGDEERAELTAQTLSESWREVFLVDLARARMSRGHRDAERARTVADAIWRAASRPEHPTPEQLTEWTTQLLQAARQQREAAARNPHLPAISSSIASTRCLVHWRAHEDSQAREVLEEAILENPTDGSLHGNLGHVLMVLNEPERAERAFQRAIQLDASSADARAGLGVARHRQGKADPDLARDLRALGYTPDGMDHLAKTHLWRPAEAADLAELMRDAR